MPICSYTQNHERKQDQRRPVGIMKVGNRHNSWKSVNFSQIWDSMLTTFLIYTKDKIELLLQSQISYVQLTRSKSLLATSCTRHQSRYNIPKDDSCERQTCWKKTNSNLLVRYILVLRPAVVVQYQLARNGFNIKLCSKLIEIQKSRSTVDVMERSVEATTITFRTLFTVLK